MNKMYYEKSTLLRHSRSWGLGRKNDFLIDGVLVRRWLTSSHPASSVLRSTKESSPRCRLCYGPLGLSQSRLTAFRLIMVDINTVPGSAKRNAEKNNVKDDFPVQHLWMLKVWPCWQILLSVQARGFMNHKVKIFETGGDLTIVIQKNKGPALARWKRCLEIVKSSKKMGDTY